MALDGTVEKLQKKLYKKIAYHTSTSNTVGTLETCLTLFPRTWRRRWFRLTTTSMIWRQLVVEMIRRIHHGGFFVAPAGPPATTTLGFRITAVQPDTREQDIRNVLKLSRKVMLEHSTFAP
ncbi:expressed unknown protein [Seminavis robusta]|uniref:Uncharacterized protein n=1 Tax=Seminavis robusta TaxID=568900 RepID=A0A9N8DQ40_9STRA|nr:expressed unknown protein [Seminavis robusta]|eukprot:Sro205_g086100.1 n/a (121) ;mRNA; r:4956-5318